MADADLDRRMRAVRRFNRFYTRTIGVLGDGVHRSPFSLTEARVMWELAHRDGPTAAEVGRELGLDAGYLSRILLRFQRRGLVERTPSARDARRSHLSLTRAGREAFAALDAAARGEVEAMLGGLGTDEQERVLEAMETIRQALDRREDPAEGGYALRDPRPGDLGWVVQRHGELYWREHGWDERFEALVAEVAAGFGRAHDPARERCWIAEADGRRAGSIFLVRATDEEARLRLLLVEPWARGRGVGPGLVDACLAFARQAGYRRVTLWTNDVLHAARRIYQARGFRLVREEPHRRFGVELTGQWWALDL